MKEIKKTANDFSWWCLPHG